SGFAVHIAIIVFFNQSAPTDTHTLSLHDALPISFQQRQTDQWPAEIRDAAAGDSCRWLSAQSRGQFCVRPGCRGQSAVSPAAGRSEEHTSELQSRENLVCRLLLEKKHTQLLCLPK